MVARRVSVWILCSLLLSLLPGLDPSNTASANPTLVTATCADTTCPPGHWCYDAPSGPVCVANLTCDDISCAEGFHCVDSPQGPGCHPNDPCASITCPPDYTCYNFTNTGPQCVPNFQCDYVSCAEGSHCEWPWGCVGGTSEVPRLADRDRASLAPAFPNPSREDVSIAWSLPGAGEASLRIYDVAGHMVRSLAEGTSSSGSHYVRWDRRSSSGEIARPGVYFCTLRVGSQKLTRSVVLIR